MSKAIKSIGKIVKKVAPVALPVLGGLATGGALGGLGFLGSLGGKITGMSLLQGVGAGLTAGSLLGGLGGGQKQPSAPSYDSGGQPYGMTQPGFGGAGLGGPDIPSRSGEIFGALKPLSFSSPGFSFANGALKRTGSQEQAAFATRFPQALKQIDTIRGEIKVNASKFREAALSQVDSEEAKSTGTLREQMARRGLSGASFAEDTVGRNKAEFASKKAGVEAQIGAQEFELNKQLIEVERQWLTDSLQREFTELGHASTAATAAGNMAAGIAQSQAALAAAEMQVKSQMFSAQLVAQASAFGTQANIFGTQSLAASTVAAGNGAFFGNLFNAGVSLFGGGGGNSNPFLPQPSFGQVNSFLG